MNPSGGFVLAEVAPEVVPGVHLLPVLHERVDMAALCRTVLDRLDPAAVAVELPTTLGAAVERAIARLPMVSVILSETDGEDALAWVSAPGDPLVEALRWAAERGRDAVLVDPDVRYRRRHHDSLPDPHVIWELGAAYYVDTIRSLAGASPHDLSDTLREKGMAFHIQQAAERIGAPILCLVGAAHAEAVAGHLCGATAPPLARQHRAAVSVHNLHPESLTALLPDLPLAHAMWQTLRNGELPEQTAFDSTVSVRVELVKAGLRLITGAADDDLARRRRALVRYAARHASRSGPVGSPVPDRARLGRVIWRVAAASYSEQTRETVQRWQQRMFFDFARRYSRLQGTLVPGLYEWVVAARGVGDDNLAWEVFDCARTYPWQQEQAELPTARIDGDMLDLGSRKVRFRRRFFRVKQRPVLVPVRQRRQAEDPGDWLRGFDGEGICSYPPEDIVVEDYGRFLQLKAISILAAEAARSEPFTTSLLDGIDIRQTMRKWYEERVWVREDGRAPAAAGSVVVIFDEDRERDEFPYLMTWLGEHEQESDMAFYATDPTQQIVGPGIMRATYGGFMLTYPPGRLFDVWHDPDYRVARSKPEVLTMAAVDYSDEKTVVHVAASPPSRLMHDWAGRQSKRLVHIPIGSLSPITLKKLRVVHILAGREKREIARDYVW